MVKVREHGRSYGPWRNLMNYTLKLAQARSHNRHDVGHDVEKSKRVKTLRLWLILDSLRLELHPGGLSAGVVMLTWPLRGDQFTDAKLLVDELRVGIRVAEETRNVPDSAELLDY